MEKERFSFYRAPIQNVKPCREAGLEDIVRYLVSDFALERTERVRRATGEERRRAKGERLDFVTFSGVFETRHKEAIVEHSGLICMDLDHIGDEEEVREVEEYLSDDPILGATLMFRSPSGDGLKVVVRVGRRAVASDSDQTARHKELYEMIALYLKTIYELESDKTSDAARACFLCHDPAPYYNPTARCDRRAIIRRIDREIAMKRGSGYGSGGGGGYGGLSGGYSGGYSRGFSGGPSGDESVRRIVENAEQSGRNITEDYDDWLKAGFALSHELGEGGRGYYHRLSQMSSKYDPRETDRKYDQCLKNGNGRVGIGTLYHMVNR